MIYLNLVIIAFLAVFVIDYSGIVEEMETYITKILKSPIKYHIPKPFSCSKCTTWWLGLIYLIVVGGFKFVTVGFVALLSALTPEILQALFFIKGFIFRVIESVSHYLGIE